MVLTSSFATPMDVGPASHFTAVGISAQFCSARSPRMSGSRHINSWVGNLEGRPNKQMQQTGGALTSNRRPQLICWADQEDAMQGGNLLIKCIGCGALVPQVDGPTHRYMGSSPGCWHVYGEVLSREYSDRSFGALHRLTVDSYAVQHPGAHPRKRFSPSASSH